MAMTKTTAVARMVKIASGRGTTIFNDLLVDGTRSLKVWGWTAKEYQEAKKLLELYGCDVKLVKFNFTRWGYTKTQTRLHVTE